MCTTASPSEIVLVFGGILGVLVVPPVALSVAAWRTGRRGLAVAAALAVLLPAAFVVRGGAAALTDPIGVAVVALGALAAFAWLLTLRKPAARPVAMVLAIIAATSILAAIALAFGGSTCEDLMRPSTPPIG